MDYFNRVVASFMSAERGKMMIKRVMQATSGGTKEAPTRSEWCRLIKKMSRWLLYLLIVKSQQVPSPVGVSTPRNKSSALFCMQVLKSSFVEVIRHAG